MRFCEGLALLGHFRCATAVSICFALLALGACSSTTMIDDDEASSTFNLQEAPLRIAEGLKEADRRVEAFPDQLSERFAFDQDRAVQVDGEGFQVSGDTFKYIVDEWLPQVTGNPTKEEEKAAAAEAERLAQVAATSTTAAASFATASSQMTTGPQPIDLGMATPMSSTQNYLAVGQSCRRAGLPQFACAQQLRVHTCINRFTDACGVQSCARRFGRGWPFL
jgi:hypothetical protein